jgi:hypothetical protein
MNVARVLEPVAGKPIPLDFRASDHGSIVLLTPITAEAKSWAEEHLPEDCARHGTAYAIEPRYFSDINAGILDANLTIRG